MATKVEKKGKLVAKQPAKNKPAKNKPAKNKPAKNKPAKNKPAAKTAKKTAAKTTTKTAAEKPAGKAVKAPEKNRDALPTTEEEARFWSLIEDAWATQSADANAARKALAKRDDDDDDEPDIEVLEEALDGMLGSLRAVFTNEDFPQKELVAMDRVLERKLYAIDTQAIQEVTDGSDDGFLYARGFIVAMGKTFYQAVLANPEVAICDAECEELCYLPAHCHEERFGVWPETGSDISRESCSNGAGWPEGDD